MSDEPKRLYEIEATVKLYVLAQPRKVPPERLRARIEECEKAIAGMELLAVA